MRRPTGQKAAHELASRDLDMPLDRGWRESGTAAWLLAVACRTEFRERLGEVSRPLAGGIPSLRGSQSNPDAHEGAPVMQVGPSEGARWMHGGPGWAC
ncbi:DUF6000 family protein [Streptomyces coeruleorubidus]|uniref:DUF6000 family protein n=1 Tax=Streptomyces coeruleorubidus TaxID=116188 RepID=UPI0038074561